MSLTELTLEERYEWHLKERAEEQIKVNRRAAENPEDLLLNMYTNVAIIHRPTNHSALDDAGVPRYKEHLSYPYQLIKLGKERIAIKWCLPKVMPFDWNAYEDAMERIAMKLQSGKLIDIEVRSKADFT